jgi:Domain of Unknown Function with PDB structure (DUF3857)
MKIPKSIVLLLLFCKISYTQEMKLEKVTQEELLEKKHPKDTTASACYLIKKLHLQFGYNEDNGFYYEAETSLKVKIYKTDGLKQATIEIPYYIGYTNLNKDKVEIKYGATYNWENGKIVKTKLASEGKIKQNINQYYNTFTIVLPNVKVGSIFEVRYIVKSENIRTLPVFEYQEDIPVNYATFFCKTPGTYKYKTVHIGGFEFINNENIKPRTISVKDFISKGTKYINFNQLERELIFKDVPALKEEIFSETNNSKARIVNELEAILRINDKDTKKIAMTWNDVSKQMYEEKYFGKLLTINNFYPEILKSIIQDNDDEKTKMIKIFKYLQQHLTWDEKKQIYSKSDFNEVFKTKSGNVGEINLMLVGLLKAAFLEANPVVLSVTDKLYFPSIDNLNYVIAGVKIDNELYLLDATDKLSEPNILPHRCLNGSGYLILMKKH